MEMQDQPVNPLVARDSVGEGGRIVWDFLTLFAQRRYGKANAFLALGCHMVFPGGIVMSDCLQVPQRAASIDLWVKKTFERFDEYEAGDGIVVYNYGTLWGQWLDGTPFDGVRYIDRFLIRDGKIVDQQVWNDLCVAAAARVRR